LLIRGLLAGRNIDPAHDRLWTVLDSLPTSTDRMRLEASACPLHARSGGQPRELTVTPGKANSATELGKVSSLRPGHRPSKLVIVLPTLLTDETSDRSGYDHLVPDDRGSCKGPPPACRRIMIRLRSGIKGRCDRRATSTGENAW
jgi:hypothetical protein